MHHTILNEMDGLLFSFPILPQFLSCWGNLIFAVSVKGPNTSTQLQADVYIFACPTISRTLACHNTATLSSICVLLPSKYICSHLGPNTITHTHAIRVDH